MSPQDAQDTYDNLRRPLEEFRFSWVTENVDAKLQLGVHEDVSLSRYRESLSKDEPAREPRGKPERVTGRREHTEQEKLLLLIDEIERCVIVPIRIADELPKSLSTSKKRLNSIELIDDETRTTEFKIDPVKSVGGEHIEQLTSALRRIREGLGHAD